MIDKEKPFKGKLEQWKRYTNDFRGLREPERDILDRATPDMAGKKEGHYILGMLEGSFDNWIRTSYILKQEGDMVETLNSIYQLGEECK